jgi:hypothetical protein
MDEECSKKSSVSSASARGTRNPDKPFIIATLALNYVIINVLFRQIRPRLKPCFEDHVERRLRGASDTAEAAGGDDFAQARLAGLRSWMVIEPMAGDKLEDNLNPVGRIYYAGSTMGVCRPRCRRRLALHSACPSGFKDCRTWAATPAGSPISCRQSKKATRSKSRSGYPLTVATSKRVFAVTPCSCACAAAFSIELGWKSYPMNCELGKALAITVDQPWRHPTSATLAPRYNLSTTPSSAGSQLLTILLW